MEPDYFTLKTTGSYCSERLTPSVANDPGGLGVVRAFVLLLVLFSALLAGHVSALLVVLVGDHDVEQDAVLAGAVAELPLNAILLRRAVDVLHQR